MAVSHYSIPYQRLVAVKIFTVRVSFSLFTFCAAVVVAVIFVIAFFSGQ